jgi:hypothetical protein
MAATERETLHLIVRDEHPGSTLERAKGEGPRRRQPPRTEKGASAPGEGLTFEAYVT